MNWPGMNEIVEVISKYVDLKPDGNTLEGVCPFCSKEAFAVHPGRQIWHCFRCHKGGHVNLFLQEWGKREASHETCPR